MSVFVSLAVSSAVKAQTVVDTCGQIVNGTGVLASDLDCSAESVVAGVVLTGKLQLGGFTLTAPMGGDAVSCGQECRVQGPGTIRGHVGSFGGVVKLSGLSMIGVAPSEYAVGYPIKLKLLGVTMSGYNEGIVAQGRTKIVDSQLTGSGFIGISGRGISGERIGLVRSSVTGFGFIGIEAFVYTRLVDSIVTGNGLDPACSGDTYTCVDILSYTLPRLRGTSTCGTSWGNVGGPWGVCTGD